MKRAFVFSICILMLCSLCACQGRQYTEEHHEGMEGVIGTELLPENVGEMSVFSELDYQKNACNTGHTLRLFQFGPSGAFIEGSFVSYFDSDSCQTIPLCAKPECVHNTKDCNAVFGAQLQYYNGRLYYADLNEEKIRTLYSASMTGEDRTEIMQMCSVPGTQGFDLFLVHRGMVLFVSDYGSVKVAKLGEPLEAAVTLYEVTEAEKDAWTESAGTNANPFNWKFWADGDSLYFMGASGVVYATSLYDTTYANCLFQYDMLTGECEQVWSLPDAKLVGDWENAGISVDGWYVEDGVMQFHLSGNGFWMTDLSSGETQQVAAVENDPNSLGHAFYSGSNIYVSNADHMYRRDITEYGIYVYDAEGAYTGIMLSTQALVDQNNWSSISVCGVSDSHIFIWGSGGKNPGCYALKLTDLENGQWTRLSP